MFMETIKFDLNWEKFNLFWIEIWACLDWCEFYGFIEKYCSHSAVCLLIWNQFKRDVIFHSTNIFPQKNSIITSFFVFWIKIVLHCWIDVKKKFFQSIPIWICVVSHGIGRKRLGSNLFEILLCNMWHHFWELLFKILEVVLKSFWRN